MASILQRENIFINQWSLYARQKLETSGEEQKRALADEFPDLNWNISQGEEKWEATAFFSKREDVQESIRLLSSGKESYLVYEVKGTGWNEETEKLLQGKVQKTIFDIFHENVTIFSCLMGEFDGKLNESLGTNVNALLAAFDAREIEKLEESSFVSATAYTPLFSGSIKGKSEAMNLQVGLREEGLGGKTTIVVGTPIITIEY
nr:YwmB family TATA-box binding protein [Bacillus benzoevorans]